MSRQPENIAADIPPDLASVDDLLIAFGRWSMARRVRRRCGSAEGMYNGRRYPESVPSREITLSNADAMTVQRALAQVEERLRIVLEVLYIPRRLANGSKMRPEVMLRLMRIPPKLSRSRHLDGLKSIRPLLAPLLPNEYALAILPPPDTASEFPVRHMAGFAIQEQNADD